MALQLDSAQCWSTDMLKTKAGFSVIIFTYFLIHFFDFTFVFSNLFVGLFQFHIRFLSKRQLKLKLKRKVLNFWNQKLQIK